jgi:hypothetical protein
VFDDNIQETTFRHALCDDPYFVVVHVYVIYAGEIGALKPLNNCHSQDPVHDGLLVFVIGRKELHNLHTHSRATWFGYDKRHIRPMWGLYNLREHRGACHGYHVRVVLLREDYVVLIWVGHVDYSTKLF